MFLLLLSCLLSMEVDDKATTLSIESRGLPSCNQNLSKGLDSSVLIGFTIEGGVGWGSGNYFKLGKYRFIVTAAHVVEEGDIFLIDDNERVPLKLVYINQMRDVAIVVPEADLSIKPTNLKINNRTDIVGKMVNYTGFPSNLGQTTYTGFVSKSTEEALIIQSFALPGSSGSVVFDNKGRAIGVISAVKVEQSPLSPFPQLYETLVYVGRFSFITKEFLKEVFMDVGRRK